MIAVNTTFWVDALIEPWLRVRLEDGRHGWVVVGVKGNIFIVPYCERVHLALSPRPRKQKHTWYNEMLKKLLMLPPQCSVLDGSKQVLAVPERESAATACIAFKWQRKRGSNEDYIKTLERRRSYLRKQELSAKPMLLVEWIELVKELDSVIQHGFESTTNARNTGSSCSAGPAGTRRSDSFANLRSSRKGEHPAELPRARSQSVMSARKMDAKRRVFLTAVAKHLNPKVAKHLGLGGVLGGGVCGGSMDEGCPASPVLPSDAIQADSDGPAIESDWGSPAVDSDSGSESLVASPTPTPDQVALAPDADTYNTAAHAAHPTHPTHPTHAVAATTTNAAHHHPTPCIHGTRGPCKYGACATREASPAARCVHGGKPDACTYGACAANTAGPTPTPTPTANQAAPATQATGSHARQSTAPCTTAKPAAVPAAPVSTCMHGNRVGHCKYGACAAAQACPQGTATATAAAAVAATTTTSTTGTSSSSCIHGNAPTGCKYGACAARNQLLKRSTTSSAPAAAAEPAATAKPAATAARLCMHGNEPATCRYGGCGKATTRPPAQAAPRLGPGISAAADASSTPTQVKSCIHGEHPETCHYGACAAARKPRAEAPAVCAPGDAAAAAGSALCIHSNDPDTCRYGECPTKREFERMVQEELAKLRERRGAADAPSTPGPGPTSPGISTPKRPTAKVSGGSRLAPQGALDMLHPVDVQTPGRPQSARYAAGTHTPGRPLTEASMADTSLAAPGPAASTAASPRRQAHAGVRKVIKIIKKLPRRRLDF